MHAFLGTRGGKTRFTIVVALREEPLNTNQLAQRLGLHYTTVQHHLAFLEEHGLATSSPRQSYAALWFLAPRIGRDTEFLRMMAERLGVDATFPEEYADALEGSEISDDRRRLDPNRSAGASDS